MKLDEWRLKNGKSIPQMAELLDCSLRSYHNYVTGEKRPSPSRTTLIAALTENKVTADDHQAAYEAFHGKV